MSAKINGATIEFWYKSYRTCDDINVLRLASQSITSPQQKNDMVVKQTQILQGKHMSRAQNLLFLIPIELDFPRNVWICMSAKINGATIEFWYKSYRTCDDINVLRLASQSITSPLQENDMVVKQTQILQWETQLLIIAI